ncbi:hypothetical protein BED47_10220 [Gottfriedia luciferensis]|uniref:Uncharacterized protein n=1 Tax=Gottfriedia luciferensis TaxID=178774 RepID=A0ABX2ZM72_9BACI|nr:hypothetical protein BED47_10220 [Gottfriedia luciferensis]
MWLFFILEKFKSQRVPILIIAFLLMLKIQNFSTFIPLLIGHLSCFFRQGYRIFAKKIRFVFNFPQFSVLFSRPIYKKSDKKI